MTKDRLRIAETFRLISVAEYMACDRYFALLKKICRKALPVRGTKEVS